MRSMVANVICVSGLVLGLASCSKGGDDGGGPGGPSPIPGSNTATVVVPRGDIYGDTNYSPANVIIKAGGSVTWRNSDIVPHTSVANDTSWTADLPPGGSFTRTFNATGEFGFRCVIHQGMSGSVTVQP